MSLVDTYQRIIAASKAYLLRPLDSVDAVLLVNAIEQVGRVIGGSNFLLVDDVNTCLVKSHGVGRG